MRPALVGPVDQHLAVEAAGAQQRRIEDFRAGWWRPAARGPCAGVEAVQLDQELVERLLLLVVPARHRADAAAPGRAHRARR